MKPITPPHQVQLGFPRNGYICCAKFALFSRKFFFCDFLRKKCNEFCAVLRNFLAQFAQNRVRGTPSPIYTWFRPPSFFTKLRNCAKLDTPNSAILREMTFANDCANWCFFAQKWCATKEVLRMETLNYFFVLLYWFSTRKSF